MLPKVKLFLVFLAVLAVVSVFSFFDVLGGVRSAKLHDPVKPLLPLSEDVDQDGISDTDESYWNTDFQNPDTDGDGFLDGEEIASGYDPRVSNKEEGEDNLSELLSWSPGDLNPEDFNITDSFTGLIAGGIAAGDLMPKAEPAQKDQALEYVALSVIDNFYKTQIFSPPAANKVDNSKENQVKYLNSLVQIIEEDLINSPRSINPGASFLDQAEVFSAKRDKFNLSLQKVSSLPVPEKWLDIHNTILGLLHRFSLNFGFIASFESDPLKAISALNEVVNLNFETKSLLNQIQLQITANDLKLDDKIYKILDLIYRTRD